jgi:hypothetical protein
VDKFSEDEIVTIRKFFSWIEAGDWLDFREAITGADDQGVKVTEYTAYDDYGSSSIEESHTFIPWIALTDPDEYERQQAEAEKERQREEAARQRAYRRQREAEERAAYEALRRKYG